MRVGLVVNPIAGMGGRVGLKGTDGKVAEARERGAEPRAPERAETAVAALAEHAAAQDAELELLAGPGRMGADEARAAGVEPTVVGDVDAERTGEPAETTAADTRAVVEAFVGADAGTASGADGTPAAAGDGASPDRADEPPVDLVLFVGGDGTAVDVARALDDAGVDTPMLGVPAGVKVYSSVFAVTPREAGRIAAEHDRVADREVNDVDEDAFRGGEVHTELRAVRPVPVAEGLQASKQLGGGTVEGVVDGTLAELRPDATYVFGPGSTVGAIQRALGLEPSPLGVDVWRAGSFDPPAHADDPPAGELLVRDGSADEIRAATADDGDVVVVVSPIGGQGFVLGRGNQQIAPAVVRDAELEVVASRSKLDDLGALRVDTDDPELDEDLRGWTKVRVGRHERRMMQVE